MDVKIENLKFELGDPFIKSMENVVTLSYERLSETQLFLQMEEFVGHQAGNYRFRLQMDYTVILDEAIEDIKETLTQIVDVLSPALTDLPVILDMYVRDERERH